MTTVEGTFNGIPFQATLEPDGQRSHWLRVERKLRESAGAETGDIVTLEIAPSKVEPEPSLPADLRKALAAAPKARALWSDITTVARRDWIHWITSARLPATRARRIDNACTMLASGKRRVCCFDRSGIYGKSLSAPAAAIEGKPTLPGLRHRSAQPGRSESIPANGVATPTSIDEYIAATPAEVQPVLRKIRKIVSSAAPGARELMSYRMPAFKLHGILIYFAAFKTHIGLYPPVSGDSSLEKALSPYAGPKGNLKFPLDRPIPYALIKRILRLRVKQDRSRAAARRRKQ